MVTHDELVKAVMTLFSRVDTLNERTKRQTKQIQELRREIKKK